jgi:hypothetical protein
MTGSLPSVKAMKKLVLTLVAAAAWFLPGHLVILGLLFFFWFSTMATTTNTALARSTAARLAAHITATAPAVNLLANGGVINGNVEITGSLTVDSNLGVHGGTTLTGASSCSSDFTVGGNLTVNNTCTIFGSCGIHGDCNIIGRIGSNYNMPQNEPVGQGQPPNGTGGAAQYAGNFYTGSGAHNWAVNISNLMNTVIISLHNAGVYT